jgi:hypothetical protein
MIGSSSSCLLWWPATWPGLVFQPDFFAPLSLRYCCLVDYGHHGHVRASRAGKIAALAQSSMDKIVGKF